MNRRLPNNSWLMTLPLWCELHWLPCATSSGIRCTFKQKICFHNDYLIFPSSCAIHANAFKSIYIPYKIFSCTLLILPPLEFYRSFTTTMETAEYWPMAWEYSIWNAAITSLQFWAEDLNQITLGIASECIYTTFFWTPNSHTHYANYLKMSYLDILLLHWMQHSPNSYH